MPPLSLLCINLYLFAQNEALKGSVNWKKLPRTLFKGVWLGGELAELCRGVCSLGRCQSLSEAAYLSSYST